MAKPTAPSSDAGKCGSNNLAWKKAHAPEQRLDTPVSPPHIDSGAAATQPSWTDDPVSSSGIIPGGSDRVPPVSREDLRLQILFEFDALAFFGCVNYSKHL